jgi:hypothetical protein
MNEEKVNHEGHKGHEEAAAVSAAGAIDRFTGLYDGFAAKNRYVSFVVHLPLSHRPIWRSSGLTLNHPQTIYFCV